MRRRAAELARARERFLAGGAGATSGLDDAVRAEIAESWARSVRAGVDASRFDVPFHPDLDFDGSLAACARPVLDALGDQIAGTPVSVILTDSDGRVLDRRVGEGGLCRRLDAISLAPGFSYAEEHAGTNGVGTALQGAATALVVGAEHFTDRLQPFACAGAPVHHPGSGVLVGLVDVTCLQADANDLMRVVARSTARDIEHVLAERGSRGAQAVLAEFQARSARSPYPVVAVTVVPDDASGATRATSAMVSRAAHDMLDAADRELLTRRAEDYLRGPDRGGRASTVLLGVGPARLRPTVVGRVGVVLEAALDLAPRPPAFRTPPAPPASPFSPAVPGPAGPGSAGPGSAGPGSAGPGSAGPGSAGPGSAAPTRSARWKERSLPGLVGASASWLASCRALRMAAADRRTTLVAGEAGAGKAAAVRAAHLELRPGARIVVLDARRGAAALEAGAREVLGVDPHAGTTVVLRHLERLDPAGEAAVRCLLDWAQPGTHSGPRGDRPSDGSRWLVGLLTVDALDAPRDPDGPGHTELVDRFATTVTIEPLRHRADDVAVLVPALLSRLAPSRRVTVAPETMALLAGALWPANVAQLEGVLRSALAERSLTSIEPDDLAETVGHGTRRRLSPLESAERDLIVRALVDAGGNRVRAAAALGMGRATLYRRLHAFGLTEVGRREGAAGSAPHSS